MYSIQLVWSCLSALRGCGRPVCPQTATLRPCFLVDVSAAASERGGRAHTAVVTLGSSINLAEFKKDYVD